MDKSQHRVPETTPMTAIRINQQPRMRQHFDENTDLDQGSSPSEDFEKIGNTSMQDLPLRSSGSTRHDQAPIQTSGAATSSNPTEFRNPNIFRYSTRQKAGEKLPAYSLETIMSGNVVNYSSKNTPTQSVVIAIPSPSALTKGHVKTLNKQAILPLSSGISIAGIAMTAGEHPSCAPTL